MKVAFNARLLASPSLRGWNRYTVNLVAELPALGVETLLYLNRPLHEAHRARLVAGGGTVVVGGPAHDGLWEQRWLPRRCGRDGADLLHAPFNFGLPWASPCPRVLTLHDAIGQGSARAPEGGRAKLAPADLKARLYHWIARTRAHRIITVSEDARADLVRSLNLPEAKIRVIAEAAAPQFVRPIADAERARVREAHALGGPYLFYVGGWEGRKNLPFLVRAFADARLGGVELVLAGGRDDQKADLARLAEGLGVADRLRLLGWVEDADLPALYAEALAFVYPSTHEGFGLQLCEAMATGCPTLAARASCLPEVLGEGGATFSLDDVGELSALLRRLVADASFRDELARRARSRSRAFSWRKTAEQTVAVYGEVVGAARLSERP